MDDKEVRIDSGLGTSILNDCNQRLPNGNVTYTNRDKSYPDSSHPLGKTDTRPCAIIGPDRVLPTTDSNDVYMKTIPVEPWEYPENYRHPYDSIKMSEYHQAHNISPRQTFQDNMQHIMVPPTYKNSGDDCVKNPKLNVPTEGKYCDVPYSINMLSSEPKSVRSDSAMPSINPSFPRSVQPHGWPGGGIQPLKPYQAQDYYHNSEYSNCPAPRPMPVVQPQRIVHDEIHPMYTDRLYQESNLRFKPYPTSKEKFPQQRYEYPNTFQPPQNPIPKFDIQKSVHGHHYPMYPQGPYKYTVDRRYPEPMMESHPRALYPQHNTFPTHPIHPSYGPLPGNYYNNKPYPCPSDNIKSVHANKLSYNANNKIYLELENPRYKGYPSPDNFYYSDRAKLMRGDILIPGHTQINSMGQQHLYKKDNLSIKSYDHPHHLYRDHRNIGNPLARMPLHFSPNTVSISPCDSNTSNEAIMSGISQEDCGYVSQSSTTSGRSMDSGNSPADFYKRQGFSYMTNPNASRRENSSKPATDNKKGLNLSQFFQMWNEGDEEDSSPNNNKVQISSNYVSPKPQVNNNQEQLYILGSVTVPQEELSKYEHLQKVSQLPENIKGFNNIEILNQFEKLVETPGINNFKVKNPPLKEYKVIPQTIPTNHITDGTQRPVSPLDVEAKISQSVIHKEVGCNFEIKPCSPKVLNVDVAAHVHDVLGERYIEKVANPILLNVGKDAESKIEIVESMNVTSCKMVANSKHNQNIVNSAVVKPLYPLQDINANMSVCLASLPQLDSDIDLNLPEVNQQFINANKIEKSGSPHRNVPQLENTHPANSCTKNTLHQKHIEGFVTYHEADKETIKLSKYRKTKKADTFVNNTNLSSIIVSSAQRTDSVIIKNPENIKVCNEILNESLEMTNDVTKITLDNNNTEVHKNVSSENIEKAIDFSVNKNEKNINTNSEVSKSIDSLTNESHFYQSDVNLPISGSKKTKKSEELTKTKQLNKNFIDHDDVYDSRNKSQEKNTNEEIHDKLITSKELPLRETQFNDYKSEINTSVGQELNEPLKEQKMDIGDKNEDITKIENYYFTDNSAINSHEIADNLPDLSFDLADVSNEQSTHNHINSNQKIDDSKLVTAISGFTTDANIIKDNTANDGQIANMKETSNCTEQTCSEDKNNFIEVDTNILVDTIEKELEDMDTKSDVTLNILSELNPLTTNEANTDDLFLEDLNVTPSNSNVSVIKSSDLSRNIENEDCSLKITTNNIQKPTAPTDFTVEDNVLNSHNYRETLFSCSLTNKEEDREINFESPSDKKNWECKEALLPRSLHNTNIKDDQNNLTEEKILCFTIGKDDVDNKLESDTCEKIKCEVNKIIPFNITTEIDPVDTNYKDFKSPVIEISDQTKQVLSNENSYNQIQQWNGIDNNNQSIACILQNDNLLPICKSKDNAKQSNVCKKFNNAYCNRRVHRKALFSPWVQNLILYNTDNKILCKDINDTEVNILNHKLQLDESINENINVLNISSNYKGALDSTLDSNDENSNDCICKSEIVEDLKTINVCKDQNVDFGDNKLSEIFQNSNKVNKLICKNDTSCFVSSELDPAHPLRHISLKFDNSNTKLLKRRCKRSFSDSALSTGCLEDETISAKRHKKNREGLTLSPRIETNLSNIFRRNSISEIYNDGNFVILIDKELILTEESQETKICFADEKITNSYDSDREIIDTIAENLPLYEKELWVDDIACTETVYSDDVAVDVEIGTPSSPNDFISSNYETVNNESFMLCEEVIKNMENDVDVTELNICHDSTYSVNTTYDYHDSNEDDIFTCLESPKDSEMFTDDRMESSRRKAENILNHFETSTALFPKAIPTNDIMQDDKENVEVLNSLIQETDTDIVHNNKLNIIQENSDGENYQDYSCTLSTCNYSSSPEVTSTTCEDKTPGIILKISNHKRSKSSQLDDSKPVNKSKISYKLTEKKKYKPNFSSSGTLVTKAAQKYIPPIKITISDLKVKLPLPKNSLDKLKQMKKSKVEPKIDKKLIKTYSLSTPREMKKPKPKFEDVLMNIDKFQYTKPKVKNKKTRDVIPKVVIKKNESGSHYTSSSSSSSEDTQSPDLTGRKWQPWVFIEKSTFIDKMALKHKVKAIYCRRKKSYVLAEKFRKYKSVYNAKFVISQPKSDDLNNGNLKYTIRLEHD